MKKYNFNKKYEKYQVYGTYISNKTKDSTLANFLISH